MATAAAVDSVGNGLFYTGGALYFTRVLGMSAALVGSLLTIGSALALMGMSPIGRLIDRMTSQTMLPVLKLLQAGAASALLVAQWPPLFIGLAALLTLGNRGGAAASGALIAGLGDDRRVQIAAKVRSATNAGVAIGAAAGSVPLAVGTAPALASTLIVDAASFIVCALVYRQLPIGRAPATSSGRLRLRPPRESMRHVRFVALNAVISLEYPVLSLILPLWIARTSAPTWLASPLLLLNTLMVVGLQVRMSRGCGELLAATSTLRRAAWTLALAAAIAAAASPAPADIAVPLMLLFVVLHTLGELWHAASGWGLSFRLAGGTSHARFQTSYQLGIGISSVCAPLVLTALCVSGGPVGWLILAAIFAWTGLATPYVINASRPDTIEVEPR